MRFEEAYGGWQHGRLTQAEAASLLGVSERTFRRYLCRYEENGLDGLIDQRLEQVSHRKAPVDEVLRMTEQYRSRHGGWSAQIRGQPMRREITGPDLTLEMTLEMLAKSRWWGYILRKIAQNNY